MQPQYVQQASEFQQKAPLTFVIILLASLLAALIGALVWGAWRGVPKLLDWIKDRQEASHKQQTALLSDLRSDNAADIGRAEKAVTDAHDKIGREVRTSGDAIGQKLEAVHSDVRRIAAKIGASIFLLAFAGSLCMVAWHRRAAGARQRVIVSQTLALPVVAVTCSPACGKGQHCTSSGKCEPDRSAPALKNDGKGVGEAKSKTASLPDAGASLRYVLLGSFASGACAASMEPCEDKMN